MASGPAGPTDHELWERLPVAMCTSRGDQGALEGRHGRPIKLQVRVFDRQGRSLPVKPDKF